MMRSPMMVGVAAGLWLVSQVVVAQTTTKPVAKPAPKATAKAAPKAAPKVTGPSVPAATQEQKDAVGRVYAGNIPCEFGTTVSLVPDAANPGYVDVKVGKQSYKGLAEVSSTGVVRVEDRAKGGLWLQAGNKSMLMNTKIGQRIADNCQSPEQKLVAQQMESAPKQDALLK